MYLLDQTWLPFSNLMLRHVYNVLLICSDYDRFMLEEDGRVEEELYKEYTALGLSTPPKITHTNSEDMALALLKEFKFELVISMLDLGSDRVEELAKSIKEIDPGMPIIALSPSPDHRKAKALKGEHCPYIDYLFYWQGNPSIFLAMVKLVEDRMNLDHDTKEADVQVILMVEDSVRFISSYLPQMYYELIRQNRLAILEGLNDWGKTLRMRGRPKVVLARNYDEAWNLFKRYKDNILGVISDVAFPSSFGKEKAGIVLAKEIKKLSPECPVLIQSTEKNNKEEADKIGCDFIWKLSTTMLHDLERYIIKQYRFGPFLFIDPSTEETIASATTLKEVQELIKTIPIETFLYHARQNDFSRWVRAQSLYTLASDLKAITLKSKDTPEELREHIYQTIKAHRAKRARGSIAEFTTASYDETVFFSRIGKGSLGGKGRGLAFIASEMEANKLQDKYPSVYLSIPRTVVITTEFFDAFMEENNLTNLEFTSISDAETLHLFLSGKMPNALMDDLAAIIKIINSPISVRSSSLLEDSHFQPFAGVYQTSMIPNNNPNDEIRLSELEMAVKTVWASTYFSCAKEYLKRTGHSLEEEKMAVILQQVTGSLHGNVWFPNISGVARSLNYYPTEGQKAEDGVGMLAFGFGKTIVDEGTAFRFCPAKPHKPSNNLSGDGSEQRTFYALDITKSFDPEKNCDNLISLPIEWANQYPRSLKGVASTIDQYTGMLSESAMAEGIKLLTFNGIIKYEMLPLAPIVDDVLKLGTEAMNEPVEIEFAINTERTTKKTDFSILQIRPISGNSMFENVDITQDDIDDAYIFSNKIMGNGEVENIFDIVTIKPEMFKPSEMSEMALELDELNAKYEDMYCLIAAGRLGSSDPWLGIPVAWSNISKAHVIVETGLKALQVEPSEGSHFFQNMTSLGCLYLTINPLYGDGVFNYEKIQALPVIEKTKHFIRVRSPRSLIIKANGLKGKAVIR